MDIILQQHSVAGWKMKHKPQFQRENYLGRFLQEDYEEAKNDPVGSISIFTRDESTKKYEKSCDVGFERFDDPKKTQELVARGMRVGGLDFTTFSMVSSITGWCMTAGVDLLTRRTEARKWRNQ